MGKVIIGLIIISLIVGVYLLLRKKRKQIRYCRLENCLGDSDYKRLKTITPLKCLECGEYMVGSSGCCANCVNTNLLESNQGEIHCKEHIHNHPHHHHHSHQVNIKQELFIPLMIGALIVWGIKSIFNTLWNI